MPLAVQSKLLTFLQSRRYYRLGGAAPIEADVRVVAATNADLPERVAAAALPRGPLLPPQRARGPRPPAPRAAEDIAPHRRALRAARWARRTIGAIPLSRAARLALAESEWPGNVRQLENAVQRGWAVALSEGAAAIEPRHLFPDEAATRRRARPPPTRTRCAATRAASCARRWSRAAGT